MRRLALTLAGLSLLAMPAAARHHGHGSAETRDEGGPANPGQFDYLVLSLSWSPGFCELKHDTTSEQCRGTRPLGFVVHGLWPQYEAGRGPEYCPSDAAPDDALVESMLDIMPSRYLVRHEWETHGTCSGLTPRAYFAEIRRAFAKVTIPEKLRAPRSPVRTDRSEIERLFSEANPGLSGEMIAVECQKVVSEVRLCMDKALRFRACGRGVTDHCGTSVFPPVR
jgi:ribonuclease T2